MNLPDEDHVVRHVPWTRLLKDEDDNVLGFLPQAFKLREEERALSVSWLEHYDGTRDKQIHDTVRSVRQNRSIRENSKCAFGIGCVGEIKNACKAGGATTVRIVWAPTSDPGHSSIKNLPRDDLALLGALADSVFSEIVLNTNVPK